MNNVTNSVPGDLKDFGIAIESDLQQPVKSANECRLKIVAQFPDEGVNEINIIWFRSLFITCISQSNQGVGGGNLLKSRIMFPSDIRKVTKDAAMVQLTLRINLGEELQRQFLKDCYYIQVSARQYLSNVVTIEVLQ